MEAAQNLVNLQRQTEQLHSRLVENCQQQQQMYEAHVAQLSALPARIRHKTRRTLKGHILKVYDLAWSSDSASLASISQDQRLIVWDVATGHKVRLAELPTAWVLTCAFAPNTDAVVAYGGMDHHCTVHNLAVQRDEEGGEHEEEEEEEEVGRVGLAAAAAGGKLVLSGHQDHVTDCAFVDEKHLLTASADKNVILWDVETRQNIGQFKGHVSDVSCIDVNLERGMFASSSCDKTIKLWDLRVPGGAAFCTLTGHTMDVSCARFLPDGRFLVSGSDDKSVRLFYAGGGGGESSGSELAKFEAADDSLRLDEDSARVKQVASSYSGRLTFANLENYEVCVLDTFHMQQRSVLTTSPTECLDVAPNGSVVATAKCNYSLKLWC